MRVTVSARGNIMYVSVVFLPLSNRILYAYASSKHHFIQRDTLESITDLVEILCGSFRVVAFFPFLLLSMSYVIYSKPDLSVMRIYITCHFNCCHNFIPLVNFSFYISHSLIFASLSIINAFRLLICMYSFWFNSMWFDSVFALTSIPMLI